jgi:type I restriction-modification system DNA methylase subunit
MALKKSELYSSLWSSCDELRGGMDASQYKDYVLVLLFIKYVSDKYAGVPYAPIMIPEGASFKDMVALRARATSATRSTRRSGNAWNTSSCMKWLTCWNPLTTADSSP